MKTINKQQWLFNQGLTNEDIRFLVSGVSGRRTCELEELKPDEWEILENFYAPKVPTSAEQVEALEREAELKRQRAQVLAIATRCGIHQPDSWQFFNTFMEKRSVLKKPLYRYTLEEMPLLINQMRGLEENERKSAQHAGTKAWYRKRGYTQPSAN